MTPTKLAMVITSILGATLTAAAITLGFTPVHSIDSESCGSAFSQSDTLGNIGCEAARADTFGIMFTLLVPGILLLIAAGIAYHYATTAAEQDRLVDQHA